MGRCQRGGRRLSRKAVQCEVLVKNFFARVFSPHPRTADVTGWIISRGVDCDQKYCSIGVVEWLVNSAHVFSPHPHPLRT